MFTLSLFLLSPLAAIFAALLYVMFEKNINSFS
ncbi:hypothetical protein SAMN05878071_0473 [Pseudoalteromonas marina]|nr:hypothetical protein SAMN05878071_0473 [Pseudoalteromonas marina]